MKILFLTNSSITESLSNWLKNTAKENVQIESGKITAADIKIFNPEFLISYNYRFIIKKDILDYFGSNAVNLHISYLPYNKGAHPNLWSFIENTPKGVTIHRIDAGLDTGDILFQKEVKIDVNKKTLDSSYNILHEEIQELLKKNWDAIKSGYTKPSKQKGKGTFHVVQDYKTKIEPVIEKTGWDIPINTFIQKYYEYNKNRKEENR